MIAKALFSALALLYASVLCLGQSLPHHPARHPSSGAAAGLNVSPPEAPLRLWYTRPAGQWEETLPLGNGRLGLMPDGGASHESVVLNDITLWSGAPQDANNYEAYKKLPEIRQLLLEGKNDEAQHIIDQSFICKGPGSGGANYGCYQTLGRLDLQFDYKGGYNDTPRYDHYERELSLDSAIARCTCQIDGTTYTREYFTSFDDDIELIRLHADKAGKLNCRLTLQRPERAEVTTKGRELIMSGQLDNGIDGKGMLYQVRVAAKLKGGTLQSEEKALVIKNATEVILYISAGTNWKNPGYLDRIARTPTAAEEKPYTLQRRRHIDNYRRLFARVHLNLAPSPSSASAPDSAATGIKGQTFSDLAATDRPTPDPSHLPTDARLAHFHNDPPSDNGLSVLFYQYGRYLSISSTRVGLLPSNLQGLWANQIQTPWTGDYHLDINVEMNHWPLEVSNLSELNLPLAELVSNMVPNGQRTAKAYYNADGWVAHVITNIWGFTEPGESASWGITKVGSGWLCNNLWQHYEFTNDKAFLQKIYPILKGSARFYNSMLIKEPKSGWWVTAPSSSPENGFYLPNGQHASICMGPTIDNQIIRELFGNVITASRLLKTDELLRDTLAERLHLLPPPGVIAKDGRLMEWLEDYKELEPHHRCISHLYGLYPASLITPESTPDLSQACKKTLEARGDDGPGFSIAYKMLWWGRLHDGNRAYKLFEQLIHPTLATFMNYGDGGGIYPNLLNAGPPFQIDGNFGATSAIAELLLQSHAGYIELLPALPDAWKASGEVRGLKARGNFTINMKWEDGKVVTYRVASTEPRKIKLKVNGVLKEILSEKI